MNDTPQASHLQVVTTLPTRELALGVARLLVERRLAACAQMSGPVESVYRWQGTIESGTEWYCLAKTTAAKWPRLESTLRAVHPYDTPELLATEVAAGSDAYLAWLDAELLGEAHDDQAILNFHANLHVRSPMANAGQAVVLGGQTLTSLEVPADARTLPFDCSFEEATAALAKLERMVVEPDGSFVWVPEDAAACQVDGVLYDRYERLLYVELRGRCTNRALDRLLKCCSWPATQVMFQLAREAVFLAEDGFRQAMQAE